MDAVAAACHHCGEPLPETPVLSDSNGGLRAFCCEGCAAFVLAIASASCVAWLLICIRLYSSWAWVMVSFSNLG